MLPLCEHPSPECVPSIMTLPKLGDDIETPPEWEEWRNSRLVTVISRETFEVLLISEFLCNPKICPSSPSSLGRFFKMVSFVFITADKKISNNFTGYQNTPPITKKEFNKC